MCKWMKMPDFGGTYFCVASSGNIPELTLMKTYEAPFVMFKFICKDKAHEMKYHNTIRKEFYSSIVGGYYYV